jgi:hypothetical protein
MAMGAAAAGVPWDAGRGDTVDRNSRRIERSRAWQAGAEVDALGQLIDGPHRRPPGRMGRQKNRIISRDMAAD